MYSINSFTQFESFLTHLYMNIFLIVNICRQNIHRKSITRVMTNRSMISSFIFFIYTSFIHISFILNISVARLLTSFFLLFLFFLLSLLCIRVNLCWRYAFIEFIALIKRSFATLSLTYYRYYRYHYRKNKSLNNHIRAVEPSRIVGKKEWQGIRENVFIYIHALHTCILSTHM